MADYPKAGAAQAEGSKKIAVLLKFTEDVNYYVVLMPADSSAPTAQQIMDHVELVPGKSIPGAITVGSGLSIGDWEFADIYEPDGLEDATNYDLYFVLKDEAGNISTVEKLTVSTPAPLLSTSDPERRGLKCRYPGSTLYISV
jgi:hypothetical protein